MEWGEKTGGRKNDILKKATESINPHDEPSRLERRVPLRTALFWVITQPVVVISYRRFGTTYPPHLQGSRFFKKSYGKHQNIVREKYIAP